MSQADHAEAGSSAHSVTANGPPGTLTTYELRDRRHELELALHGKGLDERTRAALERQLRAVIAEQQERARLPWAAGA